jgi:hypothetical protein
VMDDSNGQAIPYQALSVAIPVMVLSIISLLLSLLWFTMQQYHSERWSCMASSRIYETAHRNKHADQGFRCGSHGTRSQRLHDGELCATMLVRDTLAARQELGIQTCGNGF